MIRAKVVWPPYPYEAGFCITDDPDAATFVQIRAVYDFLMSKSFVTTKAVWVFEPEEKCGFPATPDSTLRGITLQDKNFLSYCQELNQQGFELCSHGASAGNNRRKRTYDAFDFLIKHFDESDTFICHSKNADNIYWEDKITSLFPFREFLCMYSKHLCEGELEVSPYFWGDLCRTRINQVRLYRTRCLNTLARNPSMPYYDAHKPYVNGWFTATKRSLAASGTESALNDLKRSYGLTVLYQYLHRYADAESGRLNQRFVQSINQISSDSKILVGTVSSIMNRLRLIQGIFILYHENLFWLINMTDEDINDLQIVSNQPLTIDMNDGEILTYGCKNIIKILPKSSITRIKTSDCIRFYNNNSSATGAANHLSFKLPYGRLWVNLDKDTWVIPEGDSIPTSSFILKTIKNGTNKPIFSVLSIAEELGLIYDQFNLIAREIFLNKRSLNINKYLDSSKKIPLENHDNW